MSEAKLRSEVVGLNGVPIPARTGSGEGFRTYEVHQRERVGQSTEKIKPAQLVSEAFARDPYPQLAILREHYPCYRDWLSNCYWVTRYDDVTSIFTDEANFETRSKQWFYGFDVGRDTRGVIPVLEAIASGMDRLAEPVATRIVGEFADAGSADLALQFAARVPLELLFGVLSIPEPDQAEFAERYWRMQRGVHWNPRAGEAGKAAIRELIAYFQPMMAERRAGDGEDLVSTIARLDFEDGPGRAEDVVATLLEADHETLHGALANLWFLLLTHPDQLDAATADALSLKIAYLETLRHSPPVLIARRFARHEVERFGKLLPEGALLMCSAGAANRDPRIFEDPDSFVAGRRDICHREARGQFRADGLATGVTFGLGPPSKYPAIPEDRPRSIYALTRDAALTACGVLVDAVGNLALAPGANPTLKSLSLGEMHTCWQLPVTFEKK